MYKRILMALDASPADEAVIEHIEELAAIHKSHVILLRVAHAHTRDGMTHEVEESEEYIENVAKRLAAGGIEVETVVAHGEPSEEIVREAEERNVDLIAMATHGRSGIGRWLLGSVTSKVLQVGRKPVMAVRSK